MVFAHGPGSGLSLCAGWVRAGTAQGPGLGLGWVGLAQVRVRRGPGLVGSGPARGAVGPVRVSPGLARFGAQSVELGWGPVWLVRRDGWVGYVRFR